MAEAATMQRQMGSAAIQAVVACFQPGTLRVRHRRGSWLATRLIEAGRMPASAGWMPALPIRNGDGRVVQI